MYVWHLGLFVSERTNSLELLDMETKIMSFSDSLSATTEVLHEHECTYLRTYIACGQICKHYAYGSFKFV